jgi:hypothetical protein
MKTGPSASTRRTTESGWVEVQESTIDMVSFETTLQMKVRVTRERIGRRIHTSSILQDSNGIAFDHAMLIFHGLENLRRRVEEEDLAFHLMPDRFTLTELQQVTEIILGHPLLKANFRRKIAGRVRETGEATKEAGHRPSMLFRYEPDGSRTSP